MSVPTGIDWSAQSHFAGGNQLQATWAHTPHTPVETRCCVTGLTKPDSSSEFSSNVPLPVRAKLKVIKPAPPPPHFPPPARQQHQPCPLLSWHGMNALL